MRIAVEFMTPVFLLSDGYVANGAEPWRIPNVSHLKPIIVTHPTEANSDDGFMPYKRNERLARPWAEIGTPGLEHRIGGLEKADTTGHVEYSPENHQHMTDIRASKVAGIADFIPEQTVEGPESGKLLVVSWGGTYGSVRTAVRNSLEQGKSVAHAHLRYLNPFPKNFGDVLKRFKKVLVAELNSGQLRQLIRAEFLLDAIGLNKVQGKPFSVAEIEAKIEELLAVSLAGPLAARVARARDERRETRD